MCVCTIYIYICVHYIEWVDPKGGTTASEAIYYECLLLEIQNDGERCQSSMLLPNSINAKIACHNRSLI